MYERWGRPMRGQVSDREVTEEGVKIITVKRGWSICWLAWLRKGKVRLT